MSSDGSGPRNAQIWIDAAAKCAKYRAVMKASPFIVPFIAMLALASCSSVPSSPRFSPFIGAPEVITGKGGSMTQVDGMDVWENGSPSRKIRLVGYISESEKSPAPVSQIVGQARQQGGDTIVHIQPKEGVKYWAVYKYVK